MIQRIQSIFLLVVAIIMCSVLFMPLWSENSPNSNEVASFNAFQLTFAETSELTEPTIIQTQPTFYISILAVLAAGIALFSIFQYKNRLTQIKLGALNSLFMGGTIGLIYFFSTKAEPMIPNHQGNFEIGFFIVAVAMLCNSMANRFIRKDEKLVRSADRIR